MHDQIVYPVNKWFSWFFPVKLEPLIRETLPKIPPGLHEAVQRLLSKEPKQRPTSQLLALLKYFADPTVHSLQYLDVISMKDPTQKANFYRHQLKEVLPYIPKVNMRLLNNIHPVENLLQRKLFCANFLTKYYGGSWAYLLDASITHVSDF